jgi:hypothetical protein
MKTQPITDTQTLIAALNVGLKPKYLFFWGHQPRADGQIGKECFSQWADFAFEIDGIHYATAEHYMMVEKARLFGDEAARQQILVAPHPDVAKKLGRGVQGFDAPMWEKHRLDIVIRGNQAKFSQNSQLKAFILSTGERILVEASPLDPIWGIGLAEDHLHATDPQNWRGLNLLGFALMIVRTWLRETDG